MNLDLSGMLATGAIGFVTLAPDEEGWSPWTLTRLLGRMLRDAQRRYGERDRSWTILGIEFAGARPCIWYPTGGQQVLVRLSENAASDVGRAVFQLSHEVIHLLAPTGGKHAPRMEEGLATLFSVEISAGAGIDLKYSRSYLACMSDVQELLGHDPDAILKLRAVEPTFHLLTPELVMRVIPGVPRGLAETLCRPYSD